MALDRGYPACRRSCNVAANYCATLCLVVVQPPMCEAPCSLTLVTETSVLLYSIPYLQLFVDEYMEGRETFSLFVKVLQMRILNSRWLSREEVLKRLLELRAEVVLFLKEKEPPFSEHFERRDCIRELAYLTDIFNHINEISLSVQGPEVTIMDATEILQAVLAG